VEKAAFLVRRDQPDERRRQKEAGSSPMRKEGRMKRGSARSEKKAERKRGHLDERRRRNEEGVSPMRGEGRKKKGSAR